MTMISKEKQVMNLYNQLSKKRKLNNKKKLRKNKDKNKQQFKNKNNQKFNLNRIIKAHQYKINLYQILKLIKNNKMTRKKKKQKVLQLMKLRLQVYKLY